MRSPDRPRRKNQIDQIVRSVPRCDRLIDLDVKSDRSD